MKRHSRRALFVASLLATLAAPPLFAANDLPSLGTVAESALPQAEENRIGRDILRSLRGDGDVIDDAEVNAYLADLGPGDYFGEIGVLSLANRNASVSAATRSRVSLVTRCAQIVTLLVGDQEFDSPKTLAAFALGLVLFLLTLALNILALRIVRKYREQYE